jgi:hypothetical protein
LNANAQCCPYITDVEVIPTNPISTDVIKIVTTVTTPNQGQFIYNTFSVSGNTINVEACYYSGLLTATQTYIDTLNIGMLPVGNYTIDFTAYQATDTICNYSDSMSMTTTFTVTNETSGLPSLSNDLARIYPNPSAGIFKITLSDKLNVNRIVIRSITGEMVFEGAFTDEFQVDLNAGMYFVELLEDETLLGNQRLVIH